MSWEAVTWANKQRLKKSFEQIVLLVVANCADPNGEAFVKWPGKDHWWKYLCDKTRLPKSSLFRHLNTLVALDLCERSTLILSDGSKRPTLKLNMTAVFNIECVDDCERYEALFIRSSSGESPPGTDDSDDTEADQNDSDNSPSEAPIAPENPQSPTETGTIPSAGNGSFPVAGMHRDSKNLSKDSTPTPPPEGTRADDLWEEFRKAWGEEISKFALAIERWERVETLKRPKAIAAAKGYWAWRRAHSKPPAPVSAQAFLKDNRGWDQWLRYVPSADGQISASASSHRLDSPAGKAIIALYEIAGCEQALKSFMIRNGAIAYRMPINPRLLALANARPKNEWVELTHQQAGAWQAMLSETVTVARQPLHENSRAPWSWPPKADGTIYTITGPPPDTLMTEQDMADFN